MREDTFRGKQGQGVSQDSSYNAYQGDWHHAWCWQEPAYGFAAVGSPAASIPLGLAGID